MLLATGENGPLFPFWQPGLGGCWRSISVVRYDPHFFWKQPCKPQFCGKHIILFRFSIAIRHNIQSIFACRRTNMSATLQIPNPPQNIPTTLRHWSTGHSSRPSIKEWINTSAKRFHHCCRPCVQTQTQLPLHDETPKLVICIAQQFAELFAGAYESVRAAIDISKDVEFQVSNSACNDEGENRGRRV